jgi:cobalt-zinc-cadmium efflux system outer membrane protein
VLVLLCAISFGCASNHNKIVNDNTMHGSIQDRADLNQLLEEVAPALATLSSDIDTTISESSKQLLNPDDAVRLALKNNPNIKQHLARLDLAEADIYNAARIRNPLLEATKLSNNGGKPFFALSLMLSVSDLFTRSSRKTLANKNAEVTKYDVADEIVSLAANTQRGYYHYVHAKHQAKSQSEIHNLAELAYKLAQRFHAAGNLTDLELAEKQASAAQAQIAKLHAQTNEADARARLAVFLGLSVNDDWQTPDQLSTATVDIAPDTLLAAAKSGRLDLRAAATRSNLLEQQYRATSWQRWLGDASVGLEREREGYGEVFEGGGLEVELPAFTQHNDDVIRARAEWVTATAQYQQLVLAVENQTLTAATKLALAKERVAVYEKSLLPARSVIVDGTIKRQNYMLAGGFTLLDRKLQQLNTEAEYVDALGEYWAAWSTLCESLGGARPDTQSTPLATPDADANLTPPKSNPHHHHHN